MSQRAAAGDDARPGEPTAVDRLLAAYLGVAGLAVVFPHRSAATFALVAAHLLAIGLLLRLPPFARVLAVAASAMPGAARVLRAWHPLLLVPFLYAELPVLNTAVHGGRFFDDVILGWEAALFGGQPSVTLARELPYLLLSEALHAAYLAYYPIIYVPPLILWLRERRVAFAETVFAVMLAFVCHYVFFIYFPVQGPRYLFTPPGGAIATGGAYALAHRILEAGSSRGAAFPSAHVGIAVAQCVMAARTMPRLAIPLTVVTTGLAAGAVYGGFHYATDVVAGAVLGGAAALAAPAVRARLR